MGKIEEIREELKSGEVVPFLGFGIYEGLNFDDGSAIPSSNESLILSINNNRAMTPRLMVDYSRAAMSLEQKKGRIYIDGIFNQIYSKSFETPDIIDKLLSLNPPYIIDTNYDSKIQDLLKSYNLIKGIARITAEYSRYTIYDISLDKIEESKEIDFSKPILFKPLGSPKPTPNFIASDADFVDFLTEAMGGFAMPKSLKEYRVGKKYLYLGIPFDRDTERMVANELCLDLKGGYALIRGELPKRAKRFFEKNCIEQIDMSIKEFTENLNKR